MNVLSRLLVNILVERLDSKVITKDRIQLIKQKREEGQANRRMNRGSQKRSIPYSKEASEFIQNEMSNIINSHKNALTISNVSKYYKVMNETRIVKPCNVIENRFILPKTQ